MTMNTSITDKIARAQGFHVQSEGGVTTASTEAPREYTLENALAPSKSFGQAEHQDLSYTTHGYMGGDGSFHTETIKNSVLNSVDLTNGLSGILGTARSSGGLPIGLGEMTPETVVSVGGATLTLGTAERIGLVSRHPQSGLYFDPWSAQAPHSPLARQAPQQMVAQQPQPQQPQQPQPQPQPQEDLSSPKPFADADTEKVHAHITANVSEDLQYRAANEMETLGEISEATIERMAGQLGVLPHQLLKSMENIMSAYSAQGRDYISERGVDPAEFQAWAQSHAKRAFTAAQRDHFNSKNPARAYSRLVNQYLDALPQHSPELAEGIDWGFAPNGGKITGRKSSHGGTYVLNIPGVGEMQLQQARQLGFVKFSRGK